MYDDIGVFSPSRLKNGDLIDFYCAIIAIVV